MGKKTVSIRSILGGKSPSRYFGGEGQFLASLAVDPDYPITSTDTSTSGMLVPTVYEKFSSTNVTGSVYSIVTNPKDNLTWTVQSNGKVVTYLSTLTSASETLIGTVAGSNAVWAEYYNNYIYIFGTGASKNDVSRVGPLNTLPYDGQTGNFTAGLTVTGGSSGATAIIIADVDGGATGTLTLSNINGLFIDNETITDTSTGSAAVNRTFASLITDGVWTGATLGSQTALTNTKYPAIRGVTLPNHVACTHGDGTLYFLDFINGQGILHKISTRRVTNEGDTNGTTIPSLYNALDFPFGFYPMAIASFSTDLAILTMQTVDPTISQGRAALFLWDPTNTDTFYRGPMFLPDPLATALLYNNGVLYLFTGNASNGMRVSAYAGGDSIEDVTFLEEGVPPMAGAVSAMGNRLIWGGATTFPETTASVFSYGSKNSKLPKGINNIIRTTSTGANPLVTALKVVQQASFVQPRAIVAWDDDSSQGIDKLSTTGTYDAFMDFPVIPVGKKFKIIRIRIPLGATMTTNMTITPTLFFDESSSNVVLATINSTNYNGQRYISYKEPELNYQAGGMNNFYLRLNWTGTASCPVLLPIEFELEIFEDDTNEAA